MTLAQDLGIDELKAACEDYVVSTLSVTNACTYLAAVMEIQEKSSSEFFHLLHLFNIVTITNFSCSGTKFSSSPIVSISYKMAFISAHFAAHKHFTLVKIFSSKLEF